MDIKELKKIVVNIVRSYEGLPSINIVRNSIYAELEKKTEPLLGEISELMTDYFKEEVENVLKNRESAFIAVGIGFPIKSDHIRSEECIMNIVLDDHVLEF